MQTKDIKINNILNSYNEIVNETQNNNPLGVYSSFYNYLYNVFALRESLGEKDTIIKQGVRLKKDSVFGALKYLYEAYKHKIEKDADLLLKLNLFVYVKKYPYSYPYAYGKAFVRFEDIINEVIDLQEKEEHKKRFEELYKKYLQGNLLEDILYIINKEIFKEKNNG